MRLVSSLFKNVAIAISRQNTSRIMISAMVRPSTRPRWYDERCCTICPLMAELACQGLSVATSCTQGPGRTRRLPGMYFLQELVDGNNDALCMIEIDLHVFGLNFSAIVERFDCQ